MNPRTKFFRSLALIGALGVGLVACDEGDTIVSPDPTPTITASPANITIGVGETQNIVASVSGLSDTGVSYESLNSAVATVSGDGVVTGVSQGTATIRVSSTAQTSLQTAVGVTVTGGTIPPSGDENVVIQSITEDDGTTPVDDDDVTGQIHVTLGVDRGSATRLEVQLVSDEGTLVACAQNFGTSGTSADGRITAPNLQLSPNGNSVVCSIDTDEYDEIVDGQGIPTYANGDYTVRAVLLGSDGSELDAAESEAELSFDNDDYVDLEFEAERQAVNDDTNLLWHGGNITVYAVPVSFNNQDVNEVEFEYGAITEDDPEVTDQGFAFVLYSTEDEADDNDVGYDIEDVLDADFDVEVETIIGNEPGPSTSLDAQVDETIRVDIEDPDAGELELVDDDDRDGWINDEYDVEDGHGDDAGDEPDDGAGVGVAGVEYRLFSAEDFEDVDESDQEELAEAFEDGSPIEDLEETEDNDEWVIIAQVSDELNNVEYSFLVDGSDNIQEIGIDLTAPELVLTSGPGNMAVNPDEDYVFSFDDALSQFGDSAVFIRAPAEDQDDGACPIGDGSDADDCDFDRGTDSTIEPDTELTAEGYYNIEVFVEDRAGNRSETISQLALVDETDPSIDDFEVPDEDDLEGGESANFSATAEDNLNLSHAQFFLGYAGEAYFLQYEPTSNLGSFGIAFDTETEADLSTSADFVGGIMNVNGAGNPDGTFSDADEAQWLVFDLAGNGETASETVDFDHSGDPFDTDWEVEVITDDDNNEICSPGDDRDACTEETSIRIGVTVEDDGPFDRPFSRVILVREIDTNYWAVVGESSTSSAQDAQDNSRTWTFPGVEFDPGEDFATEPASDHSDQNFRVLGVTDDGDGLFSRTVTVRVHGGGP